MLGEKHFAVNGVKLSKDWLLGNGNKTKECH